MTESKILSTEDTLRKELREGYVIAHPNPRDWGKPYARSKIISLNNDRVIVDIDGDEHSVKYNEIVNAWTH